MDKFKSLLKNVKDKIMGIYTGTNGIMAAVITVTVIAAVSAAGIILIKSFTADTADAANPQTSGNTYEEETLHTEPETTTEEETTEEPSTTEVTTVETTTVQPAATVPETTAPLETIPVEELTTVSDSVAEEFDAKQHAANQAYEEETVNLSQSTTEKPSTSNPAPETTAPESETTAPESETTAPTVNEVAQVVMGIDVSKWQGNIDWAKVKSDGIDFVIIKAAGRSIGSDGSLYVDSKFEQNIKGALANGIPVGVYFFSQAMSVREAQEEASLILSLIKDYKITYPVVFDWETSNGYRTYTSGLSKAQMNSIASTFCDMVAAAGYTPMIYGNTWDMTNRYNTQEICSKYKVWIARYVNKYKNTGVRYTIGDDLPSFDYSFQMWQYGSTGRVNGINGNVDMNVSFFTYNGTEVPSTPIKLNFPSETITANVGTDVNLMEGVYAYNSAGLNATSSIAVSIKDGSGNLVGTDTAFNSPGTYTVTYTLKDFTGISKSVNVTLIVRSAPVITLTSDTITCAFSNVPKNKSEFDNMIMSNINSASDYEGNDIRSLVTVIYDSSLEAMLAQGTITAGTYTVTYAITDSMSLTATKVLTIIIKEQETTAPETSSASETTTENRETSSPVTETTSLNSETSSSEETTLANPETSSYTAETSYANPETSSMAETTSADK